MSKTTLKDLITDNKRKRNIKGVFGRIAKLYKQENEFMVAKEFDGDNEIRTLISKLEPKEISIKTEYQIITTEDFNEILKWMETKALMEGSEVILKSAEEELIRVIFAFEKGHLVTAVINKERAPYKISLRVSQAII